MTKPRAAKSVLEEGRDSKGVPDEHHYMIIIITIVIIINYYYYYRICIAHKFKHARVGGAGVAGLENGLAGEGK